MRNQIIIQWYHSASTGLWIVKVEGWWWTVKWCDFYKKQTYPMNVNMNHYAYLKIWMSFHKCKQEDSKALLVQWLESTVPNGGARVRFLDSAYWIVELIFFLSHEHKTSIVLLFKDEFNCLDWNKKMTKRYVDWSMKIIIDCLLNV